MVAQNANTQFVIVSNRGPVTFSLDESGERDYSRGAGGLVTALNAVSRRQEDAVWIASAQSEEDARVAEESFEEGTPYEVEGLKVVLVEHADEAYDLMYNRLANPLLWFVQHGLYDLPYIPALGDDTRRAWEEGYLPVNKNFAEAVARVLESSEGDGEPTRRRMTSMACCARSATRGRRAAARWSHWRRRRGAAAWPRSSRPAPRPRRHRSRGRWR